MQLKIRLLCIQLAVNNHQLFIARKHLNLSYDWSWNLLVDSYLISWNALSSSSLTYDANISSTIFVSSRLRKARLLSRLNSMFPKWYHVLVEGYHDIKLTQKQRVCRKWGFDQKIPCVHLISKTMLFYGRVPNNVAQMIICLTGRHLEYPLIRWYLKRKVFFKFSHLHVIYLIVGHDLCIT